MHPQCLFLSMIIFSTIYLLERCFKFYYRILDERTRERELNEKEEELA